MKCQILFSGKNKINIINLSSAYLAKRVVKVDHSELREMYHNMRSLDRMNGQRRL